jgi:hypothetical protein
LNDILNSQIAPNDKSGLGYDQNSTFTAQKNDKKSINYADALRNHLKGEDNKMNMEPLKTIFNKKAPHPKGKGNTVIKRIPPNRYQHIFLGYCYSCNNFGHKAVQCKAYRNYKPRNVQRYKNNKNDVEKIKLAQGQTQGSMLQQCTNKTLTTGPFGNTCEAGEVSPEVEAGGLQDSGVCNQAGTQICDYNYFAKYLEDNMH